MKRNSLYSGYEFQVNYSDVNLRSQIKEAINENPRVTQRQWVGKLSVSFR